MLRSAIAIHERVQLDIRPLARLAAWTCGHAAELALITGHSSQETLTPTALLHHLAPALQNLRAAVL